MTQIFNIFKKDARRHWPEIVISLALMGLSTRVLLRELNHPFGGLRTVAVGFIFSQIERGMVTLVPIAWLLLITRVIQGESLVGDRQFWVTRPYDWRKLLAAKALFIGAFISVPVLIQDAVILAATGFHPTAYLSGLLYIQWSLLGILVLIAALARVACPVIDDPGSGLYAREVGRSPEAGQHLGHRVDILRADNVQGSVTTDLGPRVLLRGRIQDCRSGIVNGNQIAIPVHIVSEVAGAVLHGRNRE